MTRSVAGAEETATGDVNAIFTVSVEGWKVCDAEAPATEDPFNSSVKLIL